MIMEQGHPRPHQSSISSVELESYLEELKQAATCLLTKIHCVEQLLNGRSIRVPDGPVPLNGQHPLYGVAQLHDLLRGDDVFRVEQGRRVYGYVKQVLESVVVLRFGDSRWDGRYTQRDLILCKIRKDWTLSERKRLQSADSPGIELQKAVSRRAKLVEGRRP